MAKKTTFASAQQVKDATGRQYHISCAPGEVAPRILLCGDPARAELVSSFFSEILFENRYREFVTITGRYQNQLVSVCATGIGTDNTEIAIVELSQCVENPIFLRIGTCGALHKNIELGDVIISSAALRYENTSSFFAPPEYPAVAHYSLVQSSVAIAKKEKIPYHLGFTATCSGFYGAQERISGKYQPWEMGRIDKLSQIGVLNLEMEASALLVLASIQNFRAGVICTVFANRPRNVFIDKKEMKVAETRLVKMGLDVMVNISATE